MNNPCWVIYSVPCCRIFPSPALRELSIPGWCLPTCQHAAWHARDSQTEPTVPSCRSGSQTAQQTKLGARTASKSKEGAEKSQRFRVWQITAREMQTYTPLTKLIPVSASTKIQQLRAYTTQRSLNWGTKGKMFSLETSKGSLLPS